MTKFIWAARARMREISSLGKWLPNESELEPCYWVLNSLLFSKQLTAIQNHCFIAYLFFTSGWSQRKTTSFRWQGMAEHFTVWIYQLKSPLSSAPHHCHISWSHVLQLPGLTSLMPRFLTSLFSTRSRGSTLLSVAVSSLESWRARSSRRVWYHKTHGQNLWKTFHCSPSCRQISIVPKIYHIWQYQ